MKIAPRSIDTFLRKPDPGIVAVLVYGPDEGLARERAEALVKQIAGRADDPFLVAEILSPQLRDDPARLLDEAAALPFGGGRRAVRLRGAGDGDTNTIKAALEALGGAGGPSPSLIIVEAGELTPRSRLRKLFEDSKVAAAIPCYLDDGQALEDVIRQSLAAHKMRATPDALGWLMQHLGADRRVTRGELEKLTLYCNGRSDVTLEDCIAVIGDAAATDLDQAIYAAGGGEMAALDIALAQAFRDGVSPITLIRAAMRHMQRLHQVTAAVAQGGSLDAAIKGLKPPLFFKVADRFRAQARAWPVAQVEDALALLSEAEVRCKSTGMPAELLCSRALMQIANAGRRARRA